VKPAAAGAPSAVPANAGEIHVSGAGTIKTPTEAPPKPESAKGRMFKAMEAKTVNRPGERSAPAKPAEPPAKPAAAPAAAAEPKPGEAPAAAAGEPKPGEQPSTTVDGKDPKKPSPWKMVEEYKGKLSAAEKELAALKANQLPENDRKAFQERAEKAEARAKQLEESMAFTDYSQTTEFKEKYVEPYNKQWQVAMTELQGVMVQDGQGGERAVTPQDLLTIVNAPLAKARQLADEYFGPFANDVMTHRNEIRNLFDKQNAALEDARKNGVAKKQQEAEAQTKAMAEMTKNIGETWQRENAAVLADEKYGPLFKPREGDQEWNQRLAKGYELVDKAFSQNPADPRLTPQERESVIRRHAAVRNRAAAWGALRGEVESLTAQVKALTEELGQYKESEPPNGAGRTPNAAIPAGVGSAKQAMFEALKKKAH
jgi:hypothetical protein